jgi:uncharacterized protein with PQ loop repeat
MKTHEIESLLVFIVITLLFLFTVLRYYGIDINNVKKHDILYYDLD